MKNGFRGLSWAVFGALGSAVVLATAAGANHAGTFNIGHFHTTPPGEVNGLNCSGTTSPCFEATNDTAPATGPPATAIRGRHTATTGRGVGVVGSSESTDSFAAHGVRGDAIAGSGVNGNSTNSNGVFGIHTATTGTSPGVLGSTNSSQDGAAGVYGFANATSNNSVYGVLGTAGGGGIGTVGAGNIGIAGFSTGLLAALFSGNVFVNGVTYFQGNVHVEGTLTKTAGSFRIDHPLDKDKYLQHSFVESPDMMNVYNGNVRTDRRGFATVRLPRYFSALNRSFRYQLTVLGRSFARALVWQKIRGNRFTIRTDQPGVEVSWQVTGIRKDAYANAHRIQPEIAKTTVDTAALRQVPLHAFKARPQR